MTRTNQLLGYPDDARLLIINADDFGMCHAINDAVLRTLKDGVVRSATLMTPCPWALHAMHLLSDNPDIPFGVHLTFICENAYYRFGTVAPKHKVPSLVDETGYFFSYERIPDFLARAKIDDVELESRTQIETVLAANLQPTHLDWHCLNNGGRDDIFDMTVRLAQEYGLALRVSRQDLSANLQNQGLPTNDHDMLDSFRLSEANKAATYAQMLRDLPVGLTEWAVHPGFANAELEAIQPDGAWVRQTDFDFLMSTEAHEIILEEGIILLNYQALQAVWQRR